MKRSSRPIKINPWMIATLGLIVILISVQLFGPSKTGVPISGGSSSPLGTATSVVSAKEIYPLFTCPCCDQPLDKSKICCGAAKEMIDYIDSQVSDGLSENEVIIQTVKKYGFDRLIESKRAEIKELLIRQAPEERPIISIEPESVDLGEISMAKGKVETVFKVKNVGQTDLKISGMETSCMCTTAKLKIKDQKSNVVESPEFGMHDNPTDWSATLSPGEEADLVVTFDPAAHGPEGTGAVTRTITVFSDDPIDFSKKVQFEADVVK